MRRIAALVLTLVMLTGCVQSVKLNERGVVQTIGIDLNEDGFYRVTLQVREAVGTSGAPNQPDESSKSIVVEETGRTLTEVFTRASVTQGRQMFLGSVQIIVLGEEMVAAGIDGILDFLNSNHQISPTTAIVVARGEAGELVQAGRDDPALSADGLLDVMQSAYKAGLAPKSRMIDLINAVRGEPPVAGTLALIEYVPVSQNGQKPLTPEEPLPEALFSQDDGEMSQEEPKEDASSGGQDSSEGGEDTKDSSGGQEEKRLRLSGSAMFDGQQLAGFLNPAATRGLEWMRKDMKNATVTVGDNRIGKVAAVTHDQKAKIKVDLTGDVPVFNIDVTVCSTALEKQLPDSLLFDEQARIYTAALQEHLIRGEIEAAVLDAQREGYDVMGLSLLMRQRHPDFYKAHEADWSKVIATAGYNVFVHCTIDRTGVEA